MIENKDDLTEIVRELKFISVEGKENPNLVEWIQFQNIALPMAFAIHFGYSTPTAEGEQHLRSAHQELTMLANKVGVSSIYDLLHIETPLPVPRLHFSLEGVTHIFEDEDEE